MRTVQKKSTPLSRRDLLLAGSAVLGTAILPAGLQAADGLDLNDPWDRLTALVKLRGSLDGSMAMCRRSWSNDRFRNPKSE